MAADGGALGWRKEIERSRKAPETGGARGASTSCYDSDRV